MYTVCIRGTIDAPWMARPEWGIKRILPGVFATQEEAQAAGNADILQGEDAKAEVWPYPAHFYTPLAAEKIGGSHAS